MCVVFVNVHERRSFLKISPHFFFSNFTQKKSTFFSFPFFPPKERRRKKKWRRYDDDVAVGDETGRATTRAVTAVSSSDSTTASVVRARIESSSVVFSSGDIIDNSESVVAEWRKSATKIRREQNQKQTRMLTHTDRHHRREIERRWREHAV